MILAAQQARFHKALKARNLALAELERCQTVVEVSKVQQTLPPAHALTLQGITRLDTGEFAFACPNCMGAVVVPVNMLNCKIFRHGTHKISREPINPHASEPECRRLVKEGLIEGCGKPFHFNGSHVSICPYK
jgi:hypothetical protein